MLVPIMGPFQEQSLEMDCLGQELFWGFGVQGTSCLCTANPHLVPNSHSFLLSLPGGSFPLLYHHSAKADSSPPFAPFSLLWTPGKTLCQQEVWGLRIALQSSPQDVSASQKHSQTLAVTAVVPSCFVFATFIFPIAFQVQLHMAVFV